jgi:hypothetical protein
MFRCSDESLDMLCRTLKHDPASLDAQTAYDMVRSLQTELGNWRLFRSARFINIERDDDIVTISVSTALHKGDEIEFLHYLLDIE